MTETEEKTLSAETELEAGPPWGVESIGRILGFAGGAYERPLKGLSPKQLLVFQSKLSILGKTPKCFTNPHPEYAALKLDFAKEEDLAAAIELTAGERARFLWKLFGLCCGDRFGDIQ